MLVAGVQAGQSGRRHLSGQGPPIRSDGLIEVVGADHPGLGPLDMAGQLGHRHVGQAGSGQGQGSEDAGLALEQGGRRLAAIRPPSLQLARSQRMEGAGRICVAEPQLAQAVLHLGRRPCE